VNQEPENWTLNYFNYFTEVEEHFQRARGTSLFRLSTLDWALIDIWKDTGVPLEAVLRGIDAAFEKWRGRKSKIKMINSLTYCAQAVMTEAQIMASGGTAPAAGGPAPAPFSLDELRAFLERNARDLGAKPGFQEIAAALERLAGEAEAHYAGLEQTEQRLTALEEKMIAIARSGQSEEDLFASRRALDAELRPYRSKMSAGQLSMLQKQYLDRRLLETAGLPRLSLFYLR